jgi:hypothetical protein
MSARVTPRWARLLAVLTLSLAGSACTGATNVKETMNQTTTPSLVSAWKIRMQAQGDQKVKLSFRPLVSSARKYVGADYRSDGKTLWVTFKSCLVTENCSAMSPVLPESNGGDRFTYEVLLPYQGEKVLIQGQGHVQEELPLTR